METRAKIEPCDVTGLYDAIYAKAVELARADAQRYADERHKQNKGEGSLAPVLKEENVGFHINAMLKIIEVSGIKTVNIEKDKVN